MTDRFYPVDNEGLFSVTGLFQAARASQTAGKIDTARRIYGQILKSNDTLPEVYYQLAQIEQSASNPRKALKYLVQARKLKPEEPALWHLSMDCLLALKDSAGAKTLLKQAQKQGLPAPVVQALVTKTKLLGGGGEARLAGVNPAQFKAMIAQYNAGHFDDVLAQCTRLVKTHPQSAPIWLLVGRCKAAQGKVEDAKSCLAKATSLDPLYVEAHISLGQLFVITDAANDATAPLETALRLAPKSNEAQKWLGIAYATLSRNAEALPLLESTRKKWPDDNQVLVPLAQATNGVGDHDKALSIAEHVRKLGEPNSRLSVVYANILLSLGQEEASIAALEADLRKSPDDVAVKVQLAQAYPLVGDFEKVTEIAAELQGNEVCHGVLAIQYARNSIHKTDALDAFFEKSFKDQTEIAGTRAPLAFALAKLKEDAGETAASFEYLLQGNAFQAQRHPIGDIWKAPAAEAEIRCFEAIRNIRPEPEEPQDQRVIFVTGMPRSGTTLVEQILASHSTVTAGGELEYGRQLSDRLLLSAIEGQIDLASLQNVARDLSASYKNAFPEAEIVTDKAIGTYKRIGFLPQALLGSKCVIVRRDPRDNCLSMFKNHFRDGDHRYTTDLEALGKAYLGYLKTLDYWRSNCPDAFFEIQYEDLVANPTENMRALLEYCELQWQDGVEEFYKNKRSVRTLSVFQVRQPMSSKSVGGWRQYEAELQPLIKILRDGGALEGLSD